MFFTTFKYSLASPPSCCTIRQVKSSALQKSKVAFLVQFSLWVGPAWLWESPEYEIEKVQFSPTWRQRRWQSGRPICSCSLPPGCQCRLFRFNSFIPGKVILHLASCDDDPLLQLFHTRHVLHVVKILQTGLCNRLKCENSQKCYLIIVIMSWW